MWIAFASKQNFINEIARIAKPLMEIDRFDFLQLICQSLFEIGKEKEHDFIPYIEVNRMHGQNGVIFILLFCLNTFVSKQLDKIIKFTLLLLLTSK